MTLLPHCRFRIWNRILSQTVIDSVMSADISTTFRVFADTADAVAATRSRLAKSKALADYFDTLTDSDLACAARYFAGYIFPLSDQRTTSIGGSTLFGLIESISGLSAEELGPKIVRLGDVGDLAEEIWPETTGGTITLADVNDAFAELASTSGAGRKREIVASLLARADRKEAKYLVKLFVGDVRIGMQEGSVEDAVARWQNVDIGSIQWANMLLGDIGEAAVLARRNALDTAQVRLFHPLKFMLATPAADLAEVAKQLPGGFVVEDKFDGIRCQAHVGFADPATAAVHGATGIDGRHVALFSRTLDDITRSFPDLVPSLAALLPEPETLVAGSDHHGLLPTANCLPGLIFDGEIVAATGERIMPFQDLQQRLGRKTLTAAMLAKAPAVYVVYDILYGDGRLLIDEPFQVRRALLEQYVPSRAGAIRAAGSEMFANTERLDEEFVAARARGNEGLMVKDPQSTYKPGRRGREWLKIKRALATLDVVVTAVEVGNGSRRHLLSDYTFAVRASADDSTLLNVGKAYSGLTDAELTEMSVWFRDHTMQEFAHGKVRVVEPAVVIEVAFDRVQPSARHKSGYALRFPRIVRLRLDKPVAEIDTLATVRQLAESLIADS